MPATSPSCSPSDCSICITTLPVVARHVDDVRVLWLDAHGDFNTPDTTPSSFLGGMCLAAACGRWRAELAEPPLDPARVLLCGVRDLDPGERAELELAGVPGVARPSEVPDLLRDAPVYLHLDLDVLDPGVLPAQFPVEHGLSFAGLRTLLAEVGRAATFVGVEITAFEAPRDRAELAGSRRDADARRDLSGVPRMMSLLRPAVRVARGAARSAPGGLGGEERHRAPARRRQADRARADRAARSTRDVHRARPARRHPPLRARPEGKEAPPTAWSPATARATGGWSRVAAYDFT
jgi:hypothetical protein